MLALMATAVRLEELKDRLEVSLERHADTVTALAREIYEHPELSLAEERAAAACRDVLERSGFAIDDVPGVPTAFVATLEGSEDGPTIGLLAEYDALPTLGHACGHHLIAGSAVGAGLALADRRADLHGRVRVYGCPAEEILVGKIKMLEAGAFDGLDYALTFHAYDRTSVMTSANGLREFRFSFTGKASHAGQDPWAGVSALDGVLLTYQNVNALRQFIRDGARIHGIVTHGGDAFNIVPEHASCQLAVRATDPDELERVAGRVLDCAHAAALASGTELDVEIGADIAPVRNDELLDSRMRAALELLGEHVVDWPALASTDFGNVSQVVPSLLFSVATWPTGTAFHTHDAATAAGRPEAFAAMLKGALAMAIVAASLTSDAGGSNE
jgi:amidohydrolase